MNRFLSIFACSDEEYSLQENINQQKIATINKIAQDFDADITIDKSINESNSIVINSEEEYRNFVAKIKKQISDNKGLNFGTSIEDSQMRKAGCADGVYSVSGMTSGFATLNFDVSVSGGCISGISGGFTGWTLGASYTQGGTSFGCSSGTVCGTVNYNLFFEGIGTLYSERVCYSISLNC